MRAFACACTLAIVPCAAAAQSYAKLVTNGNGLALTQLSVRQKSGTSWIPTSSYVQGQDYRLIVRLTNFYPPPNYGGMATRCHVTSLAPVGFNLRMSGAVFSTASSNSSGSVAYWEMSGVNTIAVEDRQQLNNTASRTFYVYFKWNGGNVPVSLFSYEVGLSGGEVCTLPNQSGIPIKPNG